MSHCSAGVGRLKPDQQQRHHKENPRMKGFTRAHTYSEVSVSQVRVVVAGVGAVDGLFAVNLNYAAVLNIPWVLQLIEDVPGLIFNQQSRAGRPVHQ